MARESMEVLELLHEALAVLVNRIMGAEASVKTWSGIR